MMHTERTRTFYTRQSRTTRTKPDTAAPAKPDKTGHTPLGVSGCPGGLSGQTACPGALMTLAAQVARLAPSHRDPERFHVEKSEIVAELRRLARELA